MGIRRIQTKNNRIVYYDDNRKRFVRRKDWSRAFAKQSPPEVPENLTTKEKQSIKANQRIRNNGKFLGRRQEKEVRDLLRKNPDVKLVNNDIQKTFGKEGANAIIFRTLTRFVNNIVSNPFSVDKEIIKHMKSGGAFEFKTKDGERFFGMDAYEKMKEVEQDLILQEQEKGRKNPIVLCLIKGDLKTNTLLIEEEDMDAENGS